MPKGRWENFGNQVRHVLSSEGRLALPDVNLVWNILHPTPPNQSPFTFSTFLVPLPAAKVTET